MAISGIPDSILNQVPGFKRILKAVIKNQIQILLDQLAAQTGEQSVILTADIGENSFSQLGSQDARDFLENKLSVQTDFLKHCLAKNRARSQCYGKEGDTSSNTEAKTIKQPSPKKIRKSDTNKTNHTNETKGPANRKRRRITEKERDNKSDSQIETHTSDASEFGHVLKNERMRSDEQLESDIQASVLSHESETKGDNLDERQQGLSYDSCDLYRPSGNVSSSHCEDLDELDRLQGEQAGASLKSSMSLKSSVEDFSEGVDTLDNDNCDKSDLGTDCMDIADAENINFQQQVGTKSKDPDSELKSAKSGRKFASGKALDEDMRTSIILQVIDEGGDKTSGDVPRGVFTKVSKKLGINSSSVSRIWERYVNDGTIKPRQHAARK